MLDPRSNDELRDCIVDGDAPDRVRAAFELGRRLGSEVTQAVSLQSEDNPGVRCHWLTILASFGERDAVRAIAELQVGTEEGDHALHLALRLGLGDPAWLARLFERTTEHMQGVLLKQAAERVDWASTESTLELLTECDTDETRSLAVEWLLGMQPLPSEALRRYASSRPGEAAAILQAWAGGPDHAELAHKLPLFADRSDVGLLALAEHDRRYSLAELRSVLLRYPQAFALVATPCPRETLLDLTDEALTARSWLPEVWIHEAGRVLGPPWNEVECGVFDRWAATAAEATWVDDFDDPDEWLVAETAVLNATGYEPSSGRTSGP